MGRVLLEKVRPAAPHASRSKSVVMKRQLACLLAVCLLSLCLSCAFSGRIGPDAVIVRDVPFFSQEAHQCGPTALAIVMDYWYRRAGKGDWTTPEQIASDIYSPSARGVLGVDLEVFARMHGFEARQYEGSIGDLRQKVDEMVPLIILVDYGFSVYEANHFMVVTGYTKDGVVVDSGRKEHQVISEGELARIWKKTRYWTLVVTPPESSGARLFGSA